MNWWKNVFLTRLFRKPVASRTTPAHSRRFRPSILALEDRTVPSGSDSFATATILEGDSITVIGNNAAATGEPDEPNHAGNAGQLNSLWWQWTATASGHVEINTFGSNFDTVLAVYTGSALDDLTEVTSNDDADNLGRSQVTFEAVADTTYFVAVDGLAEATGDIVLNLGTAVPNDNFSAAATLDIGTATGSNIGATGEAGEPEHARGNPANSVWWQWTATQDGFATLDTVGSDFDTALAVYTGDALATLALVAENDDIAPADQFPDNPELQSRVLFEAAAGTTYFIAVDGFRNLTGHVTLNLSNVPINHPPQIGDQSFTVDENSAEHTVVGTVSATDPDERQVLTYQIVGGDTSGTFAVDFVTGEITVLNSAALDYETTQSFTLIIEVTDSGTPALSSSATVTINVIDVNERPVFVEAGPFDLNENSAAGTAVGTVAATDPDVGQTLTYAIVGGNSSGAFAIDAATGRITVANGAPLNYEVTPSFTLTVQVTDNGSPSLSATVAVVVNLRDVNDAPVLDNSGSMSLAAINQGDTNNSGTLVSDILASAGGNRITDEDAGAVRGIAVIAANTAHGAWEFSTDGGATWSALGAVSDTSTRLLAADSSTRVRFVPVAGYNGTDTSGITFRAWDRTSGTNGSLGDASVNGGSSAFSTAFETASIEVRPVQSIPGQFQALEAEVESLVTKGVLSSLEGVILEIPIHFAEQKFDVGKPASAVNYLKVFDILVNVYVQFGILTETQGQSLVTKANALIDSIEHQ